MKPIAYLALALAFPTALLAQDDIPLLLPEERKAIDDQSAAFAEAIRPALTDASKSTVRVWSRSRRLSYGTVVGDGKQILTKWSEIARAREPLTIDAAGGEVRDVKLRGIYEDEDLALLDIVGNPLKAVKWSLEAPKLGAFIATAQPDGQLAAFGVVSVLSRNLRESDLAYLGVIGQPGYSGQGVKIAQVAEKSGAAAAGLKAGNIIKKVGTRSISGLLELKNALVGQAPGSMVPLLVDDGGKEKTIKVLLGNRPQMAQYSGGRLEQMERMGGPISQVRDSFTDVIQTDMSPKPNQIGGPVVDLKGRVIGITMARADRTRSFVMPADAVVDLLKKEGKTPAAAQVRSSKPQAQMTTGGEAPPQGNERRFRGDADRVRRHVSDMERLIDLLRSEMDEIESR